MCITARLFPARLLTAPKALIRERSFERSTMSLDTPTWPRQHSAHSADQQPVLSDSMHPVRSCNASVVFDLLFPLRCLDYLFSRPQRILIAVNYYYRYPLWSPLEYSSLDSRLGVAGLVLILFGVLDFRCLSHNDCWRLVFGVLHVYVWKRAGLCSERHMLGVVVNCS